jgi:hypothetical protein
MSRSSKAFVGFLSFLPIILLIFFFAMLFTIFPRILEWENHEPTPPEMFSVFWPIFLLGIIMAILSLGLLVFFIMHLIRNKQMEGIEKVVWILVFFFAGIVGYPIYWYMRIWSEEQGSL